MGEGVRLFFGSSSHLLQAGGFATSFVDALGRGAERYSEYIAMLT